MWGRRILVVVTLLAGLVVVAFHTRAEAAAVVLPSGFQDQVVFSGLSGPTNVEFSPDGRVFVAEKSGVILVYDGLGDPTPDVFADLSTEVMAQGDRGLSGLALPPNFPADPHVYVLYSYDAPPGGTAPVWHDQCASPDDGTCVGTGRLVRLTASGNHMVAGSEQVLVSGWCQQYLSHSQDDVHFGPDGALYVSSGDGATFTLTDYGQTGNPVNPCGDPPGGSMSPPTAQGGALRAQNVRSSANPTTLDSALLRVDPATGDGLPDNPLAGSSDPNARRIIAYGLRNPYRFTFRPGTNEVWLGDVGWNDWEEIDRVTSPTAGPTNFGWPCYEGPGPQPGYQSVGLDLCQGLYSGAGPAAPYYTYNHAAKVVPGDACPTGGSAITGTAFYPASGGEYPAQYQGALFFADYARHCIWAMLPGAGGLPDPTRITTFLTGVTTNTSPVDLTVGPGGDLYYVDIAGNAVHHIRYFAGNQPPTASLVATPVSGSAPLTVAFDATGSTDPDPSDQTNLTYAWAFGDGGTATTATVRHTYATPGSYPATLTVTDPLGASDTKTQTIQAGNDPPAAGIDSPAATLTWAVGDAIAFSGHATDPQDGTLPAAAFRWQVLMHHCTTPTACHVHYLDTFTGVTSGTFVAEDHGYPSYVEVQLTVTDSGGLSTTTSVSVHPKPVDLTFDSDPHGLQLAVGSEVHTTPFTVTVIQGSTNSVSAPSPVSLGGASYGFCFWSDAGAASHTLIAPATATTLTATYRSGNCGPPPSRLISLRARANTRYVTADNAGAAPLIANRTAVSWWERFDVVDTGDGYVALRAVANGEFVTAENAGNSALIANRTMVGDWEKFILVTNADGSISLQAKINGKYVTAEAAGNSPLIANRTLIGDWEKFDQLTAISAHTSLKAHANGDWVTAENAGAAPLIANRTAVSWWERFDVVDTGDGYVALRAVANGKFVTAENAGNSALIANRTVVADWEKFTLITNADGSISLQAKINGRYVTAEAAGTAPLIANRTAIGDWEKFDRLN